MKTIELTRMAEWGGVWHEMEKVSVMLDKIQYVSKGNAEKPISVIHFTDGSHIFVKEDGDVIDALINQDVEVSEPDRVDEPGDVVIHYPQLGISRRIDALSPQYRRQFDG